MVHSRVLIQVGCKILGLLFLVSGANMFALFFPQVISAIVKDGGPHVSAIYGSFAIPILSYIFAFIFLKYAGTIAEKLDSVKQDISISPDENWPTVLYNVGIRLIGVYVVIKGVPDIISQVSHTSFRYQTASKIPISTF